MDFDVIVLGSGVAGLTCASRLSKLGFKVGVFEKHHIPGGYATNFKRRGYNFDVSLNIIFQEATLQISKDVDIISMFLYME